MSHYKRPTPGAVHASSAAFAAAASSMAFASALPGLIAALQLAPRSGAACTSLIASSGIPRRVTLGLNARPDVSGRNGAAREGGLVMSAVKLFVLRCSREAGAMAGSCSGGEGERAITTQRRGGQRSCAGARRGSAKRKCTRVRRGGVLAYARKAASAAGAHNSPAPPSAAFTSLPSSGAEAEALMGAPPAAATPPPLVVRARTIASTVTIPVHQVSMRRPLGEQSGIGMKQGRLWKAMEGYLKLSKAMEGYGRLWRDIEGYGRISKAMEGYGRLWKDIEGYRRLSKDIEGYGRLWKAMEGYGRLRKAGLVETG